METQPSFRWLALLMAAQRAILAVHWIVLPCLAIAVFLGSSVHRLEPTAASFAASSFLLSIAPLK
jgi:hypothetical protein